MLDPDQTEADAYGPISAINITPFVDVVLVLLVIFMVTAPMILKDVLNVKLPKAATGDGAAQSTLSIVIMRGGNILINGALADETTLRDTVKAELQQNPDVQAIISADEESAHKFLIQVIDWIKSEGLTKFALQVQKKQP